MFGPLALNDEGMTALVNRCDPADQLHVLIALAPAAGIRRWELHQTDRGSYGKVALLNGGV